MLSTQYRAHNVAGQCVLHTALYIYIRQFVYVEKSVYKICIQIKIPWQCTIT